VLFYNSNTSRNLLLVCFRFAVRSHDHVVMVLVFIVFLWKRWQISVCTTISSEVTFSRKSENGFLDNKQKRKLVYCKATEWLESGGFKKYFEVFSSSRPIMFSRVDLRIWGHWNVDARHDSLGFGFKKKTVSHPNRKSITVSEVLPRQYGIKRKIS